MGLDEDHCKLHPPPPLKKNFFFGEVIPNTVLVKIPPLLHFAEFNSWRAGNQGSPLPGRLSHQGGSGNGRHGSAQGGAHMLLYSCSLNTSTGGHSTTPNRYDLSTVCTGSCLEWSWFMHQDGVWACLHLIRYSIPVITVCWYSEMNINDKQYIVLFGHFIIKILKNRLRYYIIVN